MSEREDSESDAPEELTTEQGIHQDVEIRKVQKESEARVARDKKERRRQWAQRKTPRSSAGGEIVQDDIDTEPHQESLGIGGMLSEDIVKLLAAREKKVFLSDSEEEKVKDKPVSRKKRAKISGPQTVILKDLPPAQCLENSLEFLKKRKMQVSRSTSVLNNSNQALRLLSTSGLLSKK